MNEIEDAARDDAERNEAGERQRPIIRKSPQDTDKRLPGNDRRLRRRRASDKKIHFLRENWYRDVWLLIITIFVAITAIRTSDVADKLVSTRATAVADSCRADTVQADVLRTILDTSLAQQKRLEATHQQQPGALNTHDATVLIDKLLQPLGGFHPSADKKRKICALRVIRGTPHGG